MPRWRLRLRFRANDGDPSPLAWVLASISLVLPLIGIVVALIGLGQILRADENGSANGWWLIAGGAAIIVCDLVIDFIWANPSLSVTDQPALNRRGEQLVGRTAVVVDAICDGRGRVRVGDGIWTAEGADCGAGCAVRIIGVQQVVLLVEPVASDSVAGRGEPVADLSDRQQ